MALYCAKETIMTQQNVAIIGGGIIGICTALSLQQKGFAVSIIDKKGIAQECSQGNAGHFATEQVFPLADAKLIPQIPKMLLDPLGPFRIKPSYFFKAIPWFVRFLLNMRTKQYVHSRELLKQLNHHSIDSLNALLQHYQLENLVKMNGSLLTFESTPDSKIKALLDAFQAHDVDVSWLTYEQALAIEPNLSNNVKSAFHFKTGGHTIDPEVLCLELAKKFMANDGQIIIDTIENICSDDQRVSSDHSTASPIIIKGQKQQYQFDNIVLATGAWSKTFAKQLGYQVPLDTERGYHLMVQQTQLLNLPVSSAERKFIMTPLSSGLRLAGTVEFAGLDAPLNPQRAQALLPHAQKILANLPLNNISKPWMGFRPSLPDSLPVIGRSPKQSNVYFAFGHHHLGLTHGALTGQLIASQMNNEQPLIDLSPFCISRFN